MSSFNAVFLKDAVERAVKTFAQTVVGLLGADTVLSVVDVDWGQMVGVGATAAVLSLLTSVASAGFGDNGTASVVPEVVAEPNR